MMSSSTSGKLPVVIFTSESGFGRAEHRRVLSLVQEGASQVHVRHDDAHFFVTAISATHTVRLFMGISPLEASELGLVANSDASPTMCSQGAGIAHLR